MKWTMKKESRLISNAQPAGRIKNDDKLLLRRLRQEGGRGRRHQSQDVQVVYGRQVLQRRLPEEALGDA
jgi:hypothetical protein